MIIPTKYNVGHTFWVPRCVIEYSTEEMHFEGETWSREVRTYVGYAKQKRVIKIVASTTKGGAGIHIQYYVLNVGEDENGQMSQIYSQSDINDYTEEEAYNIAMEYQEQEEEYFGN